MRVRARCPSGSTTSPFPAATLIAVWSLARDAALVTQSLGNMRNLAAANGAYGADWADRQFTACPDDAGLVNGNCVTYTTTIASS